MIKLTHNKNNVKGHYISCSMFLATGNILFSSLGKEKRGKIAPT